VVASISAANRRASSSFKETDSRFPIGRRSI
jgi:hypothetical protein